MFEKYMFNSGATVTSKLERSRSTEPDMGRVSRRPVGVGRNASRGPSIHLALRAFSSSCRMHAVAGAGRTGIVATNIIFRGGVLAPGSRCSRRRPS